VECQGRHQAAISKGAREISAAEEEAARVIREANAKLAGVRKVVHEEVSGLQLEVSKRQGSCEKSKRGLQAITAQVPPKFTAATEEQRAVIYELANPRGYHGDVTGSI